MNKSMLFVVGRFGVGGVERVTIDVSNELFKRGWKVGIVIFEENTPSMLPSLNQGVSVYKLNFPVFSYKNLRKFRDCVQRNNVKYVINQWALPVHLSLLIRIACHGRNVSLLAMLHTMPSMNRRLMNSIGVKHLVWKLISRISLNLVYRLSNGIVLLSKAYKNEICGFAWLRDATRIKYLTNPVRICDASGISKENLIIFVGRLSKEKRVDRILDSWRLMADRIPDWRFEIVGDGEERKSLSAKTVGMRRVSFVGFADPAPYYRKAKLILLASDFEGFGLVLIEAMSAGCVPVLYGNYAVAGEIVDETRGILIQGQWNADAYARAVCDLANNEQKLRSKASRGIAYSQRFSVSSVCDFYESLFKEQ